MAKEIKVFSMSFLDVLCCGLGAVILLKLLTILNIQQNASQTLDFTYVIVDADIWCDTTERLIKWSKEEGVDPAVLQQATEEGKLQTEFPRLQQVLEEYRFSLNLYYIPLTEPQTLERGVAGAVSALEIGQSGSYRYKSMVIESSVSKPSLNDLVVAPAPWDSSKKRVYLRLDLHAWATRIPQGYYCATIRADDMESQQLSKNKTTHNLRKANNALKSGREADVCLARLELQGSGVAGHSIMQTHLELPDQYSNAPNSLSDRSTTTRRLGTEEKQLEKQLKRWKDLAATLPSANKTKTKNKILGNLRRTGVPSLYAPGFATDAIDPADGVPSQMLPRPLSS